MSDSILLRVIPANVETDVDGQRLQFRVGIAGISQLRLEQVHQFDILFESYADFIIELQEVPDVIGISTFLEAIVRSQLVGDRFYLTEFVDVILIWVAEPQIGTNGILILVMLRCSVAVLLQENRRLSLESIHPFKNVLTLVKKGDKHSSDLFRSSLGKSNDHTFWEVVVRSQQIERLIQ